MDEMSTTNQKSFKKNLKIPSGNISLFIADRTTTKIVNTLSVLYSAYAKTTCSQSSYATTYCIQIFACPPATKHEQQTKHFQPVTKLFNLVQCVNDFLSYSTKAVLNG